MEIRGSRCQLACRAALVRHMAPMMKVGTKESQSPVADMVAKHSREWLLLEVSEAQAVSLLVAETSSAAVAL